jgi:hypothetical protein
MSAAIEKVEASEPTHLLDTDIETGIWALGITEKSISTDVVSSGIGQPGSQVCESEHLQDDVKSQFLDEQKQFDFVHIRYQSSGLPDGPRIFRAAFAQTKPGGWIEVVENRPPSLLPKQFVQTDSNENDGKVTGSMVTMPCGSTALETATDVACWIKHQLIDVGFVEVEEKVWRVGTAPAGPWQRFMGALVSLFSMSWVGSKESKGNCRPSINGPSVFVIARKPW